MAHKCGETSMSTGLLHHTTEHLAPVGSASFLMLAMRGFELCEV